MKKQFNMRNKDFSMRKLKCSVPLLLFFVCLIGGSKVAGQGNVTVLYDKDSKSVVISNNEKDRIIFFPYSQRIDEYVSLDIKYTPRNVKFDKCGIDAVGFNAPVPLEPGAKKKIMNMKNYKENSSFYYYVVKEQNTIETAKYSVPIVTDLSQLAPKPQETAKSDQSQTKSEPPVHANIVTVKGNLRVNTDENIEVVYRFTGKYGKLVWGKQPQKVEVKQEDKFINITGKVSQEGEYFYAITIHGENGGRDTTIKRTLEVIKKKGGAAAEPVVKADAQKSEPKKTAEPKRPTKENTVSVQETIEEEVVEVQPETEDDGKKESSGVVSYAKFVAIAMLLLLVVVVIAFYKKKGAKNNNVKVQNVNKPVTVKIHAPKPKEPERKTANESVLLIEEEDDLMILPASYNVDMKDIREDAEGYYKIDMLSMLRDSTIRNVYFNKKAILDIYKFYSSFLQYDNKTNETGCFLIGRWEYAPHTNQKQYDISIEAVVEPGDDAIYGEYNLNFGAKIGITLDYAIGNMCEKTKNEYVHTVWMHSHPGLGLFLSSQDLNVQSQLAHSNHKGRMLAIVIDSNSSDFEMAFFASKQDGTMNNDTDLLRTTSLETLYKWAKTAPKEKTPPASDSTYFNLDVLPPTGKINRVLFSGATIIGMDMATMQDDMGLRGYFYGTSQGSDININEFKEIGKESGEPLGCLLIVHRFSYNEVIKEHLPNVNLFEFVAVHAIEDGNIYLLTKDEQNKYPEFKDNVTFIALMKMKEWTRRKR